MTQQGDVLANYVAGGWQTPGTDGALPVENPATAEVLAHVPLSSLADVDRAVQAAVAAWPAWRATPPTERIQPLFLLKALLEAHFEEIARTITLESGKTIGEARGEIRRGSRTSRWPPAFRRSPWATTSRTLPAASTRS